MRRCKLRKQQRLPRNSSQGSLPISVLARAEIFHVIGAFFNPVCWAEIFQCNQPLRPERSESVQTDEELTAPKPVDYRYVFEIYSFSRNSDGFIASKTRLKILTRIKEHISEKALLRKFSYSIYNFLFTSLLPEKSIFLQEVHFV